MEFFIFMPENLEETDGYLQGFIGEDQHSIYITSEKPLKKQNSNSIGYCICDNIKKNIAMTKWIHFNHDTKKISIYESNCLLKDYKTVLIYYNYEAFKESDLLETKYNGEQMTQLANAIKNTNIKSNKYSRLQMPLNMFLIILNLFIRCLEMDFLLKFSATLAHFKKSLESVVWFLGSLKQEKRITLKLGNVLASKFLDLLLGFWLLYYFYKNEEHIIVFVQESTETVIDGIKDLLSILMGSPAGLKLNYALNKTLGVFFCYNLSLWRAFLQFVRPYFRQVFRLLLIPGALGLTFQAALFADFIGFVTFHMYCIYVYAARLYWLQMHSLISLSRLFIGRKYNPLRKRVDSFQYTKNQLFIGTLGFTILLFLLPTTCLYYIVFVMLRLIIIILNLILKWLQFGFQHLPIYVGILWFFNSPSVAGTIYFDVKHETNILYVTVQSSPLLKIVSNSQPPSVSKVPKASWGRLFQNMLSGVLL